VTPLFVLPLIVASVSFASWEALFCFTTVGVARGESTGNGIRISGKRFCGIGGGPVRFAVPHFGHSNVGLSFEGIMSLKQQRHITGSG
jgi:hypothetical protein